MTGPFGLIYSNNNLFSFRNSFKTFLSILSKPSLHDTQNQNKELTKNQGIKSEKKITLYQSEGTSIEKEGNQYIIARRLHPKERPIKNLILSGGGIKGIVYPGAFKALEETGYLSGIQKVYSASMGAITGSLLAHGIKSEKLTEIANHADFSELISKNQQEIQKISKSEEVLSQKTIFDSIKIIYENLGTTAPRIQALIDQENRHSVLKKITLEHKKDKNILEIFNKLNEGKNLTFQDNHHLSQNIDGIKEFYCVATVLIDGEIPQLAVLSAETTPDWDISKAACISSALPGIFKKYEELMPGFDINGGIKKKYIDGGLLLNTPSPEIIDVNTIPSDNLILALESPLLNQAMEGQLSDHGDLFSTLVDKMLGIPHIVSFKYMCKQLASKLKEQTVIADLQNPQMGYNYTGVPGLLALHMKLEEKEDLQAKFYKKTMEHLEMRNIKTHFDSLEKLLYSLNDEEFNNLANHHEKSNIKKLNNAFQNIKYALEKIIKNTLPSLFIIIENWLNQFIKNNTKSDDTNLSNTIQKIKFLRQEATQNQLPYFFNMIEKWDDLESQENIINKTCQWEKNNYTSEKYDSDYHHFLAKRIIDSSHPKLEKIFNAFHEIPVSLHLHPIIERILTNETENNTRSSANYIIKNFIYPAKNKLGQQNTKLLNEVEDKLNAAKNSKEINDCLNSAAIEYKLNPLGKIASLLQLKWGGNAKKSANFIVRTIAIPIAERLEHIQSHPIKKQAMNNEAQIKLHIEHIQKCTSRLLEVKTQKQFKKELKALTATVDTFPTVLRNEIQTLHNRLTEYMKRPSDITRSTFLRELQTYKQVNLVRQMGDDEVLAHSQHALEKMVTPFPTFV